jgi:hypothetical protein
VKRSRPALLGVYASRERLAAALRRVGARPKDVTVLSPVRGEWLEELTASGTSPIRFCTLAGGVVGIVAGLALVSYTFGVWSFVVSGKPVVPLPPLVVLAFEFMVLFGVVTTFVAMLAIGRIPRFRLPDYYDPRFSKDRFGLLVALSGPEEELRKILEESGAEEVRRAEV